MSGHPSCANCGADCEEAWVTETRGGREVCYCADCMPAYLRPDKRAGRLT